MGSQPRKISASRGAAILGLSPYKSRVEIWRDMIFEMFPDIALERGYAIPEPVENSAVKWGLAAEDMLIRIASKMRGQKISKREKSYTKNGGYITCHIDGMYADGVLHEAKTTSQRAYSAKWGDPGTDLVPIEYQVQAQHQMYCTGAKQCIITVAVFPKTPDEYEKSGVEFDAKVWEKWFVATGSVYQYVIDRNDDAINVIVKSYLHFYENYVFAIHEPQVDSFDDLKILLPWPTGELVATDRIEEICGEHATIADEMDALKKRQDEIKTEIGRFIQEFIKGRFVADADKIEIYGKSARKICMYSKTKTGTMLRITKNKQEEF